MASGGLVLSPQIFSPSQRQSYLMELIGKCRVEGDCLIWTKCTNQGGYPQKKFKLGDGSFRNMSAHRVIFCLATNATLNVNGYAVSHLCHHTKCLKVEHMSYEPGEVNSARKHCVAVGGCQGHNNHGLGWPNCIF